MLDSRDLLETAFTQCWQIAALALLVAVVTRRFCRRRPHLACLLWMLVLVKCLTPPIWTSPVGLFSWAQVDIQTEGPSGPSGRGGGFLQSSRSAAAPPHAGSVLQPAAGPNESPSLGTWLRTAWRPLLIFVWISGSAALAGMTLIGWMRSWRAVSRQSTGADPHLVQQVAALARRLGVRRKIDVMVVDRPIGPAVFGLFRPRLIVPRALVANRRFDQIEPILAHELVHVRRHDAAMLVVELAARIVWWFHPLVWWASAEAGRERERSCDAETVAGLGCRPRRYARSLLDVLELKQELRIASALPGVRPGEVTSRRLEDIMTRRTRVRGRVTAWAVVAIAAALVLPGGPMVITRAAEADAEISAAELAAKLAQLEDAAWQAGLSAEEREAVVKLAKRMKFDIKAMMQLKALGKLSDVEARAGDKLIREFGNPLEEELAELRQICQEAGLTEEEIKAAEKVALQEAFDEGAILARHETGKLSAKEQAIMKKLLDHHGHPYAEQLEVLAEVAKAARLTDAETAVCRGLLARAGGDMAAVLQIKQSKKLSKKEAAAVAKAEAVLGKLEYYMEQPDEERVRVLFTLTRIAGLTPAETDAVMELAKKIEFSTQAALERKTSGQLSKQEAAGLAKIEGLFGKLEEIADSPHRETLGELLELAFKADLSLEETTAVVKLAVRIDFNRQTAQQMRWNNQLSELEAKAFDKLAAASDR
jgi:beta-lactamase regulating signal transducer with metallopeptidase domain